MKKLLLLPLLLSICLSASAQSSADLSFGALTCGYDPVLGDYYDVEIILDNRFVAPCAGFQFEITNILIDSPAGAHLPLLILRMPLIQDLCLLLLSVHPTCLRILVCLL